MTTSTDVAGTTPPKKSKRKMRPGGGKSKGSGFEAKIAKMLSEALTPLKFIRTPGSGARVGGKNFETLGQMFGAEALALFVADVVPVNEKESSVEFLYSIECKFYKTPDTFMQLASGSGNVFKWMQESIDDAGKTGKIPMLIWKWNNTPIYVALLRGATSYTPILKIDRELSLDIFLLDDMLKHSQFWTKNRNDG